MHKSFSEIVRQEGEWKRENPSEEWVQVQRRRLKNRFIGQKGKAQISQEIKFKAADIRVPLFINNVDKATSTNDIASYILSKTQIDVNLEMIKMKREKEYNAYKVFVPRHKMNIFLDKNLWPEGILFRPFINFNLRNKRKGGENLNREKNIVTVENTPI